MPPSAEKTNFELVRSIEPIYAGGPVAFASNARLLATSLNERVIVSHVDTGERLCVIEKDEDDYTTALALTSDGSRLVVASRSRLVSIYDVATSRRLRSIKAHEAPVIVMKIDPTDTLLATGGAEGLVKVWDLAGGFATHSLRGHGGVVSALAFGKVEDAWILASGADDTRIRIWDLATSRSTASFEGHSSTVRGLVFTDNGKFLVSGSRDKTILVWNVQTRKLARTIPALYSIEAIGWMEGVSTEDSSKKLLYAAGENNIIGVWDVYDGKRVDNASASILDESVSIIDLLDMGDGTALSVHSDHGLLVRRYVEDSETVAVERKLHGSFDEVIDCTWLDGGNLAVATNTETVDVISEDGTRVVAMLQGHEDIILALDASQDGHWLVTGAKDNTARLWRIDAAAGSYECVRVFTGHTATVTAVGLGPLNDEGIPKFVVSASQDRTLKLYDLEKMDSSNSTRALWTSKAHDRDINAVSVSPDGKIIATASQDKTIKLWDAALGDVLGLLRGHRRGVWSCCFSRYGKLLASGSGDNTLRVWNYEEQRCVRTFEGHTAAILKIAFISEGTQLATAGADGLVKIWSIKSGECVTTLDNHEDRVWALTARDEGSLIVSGGADAVLNVWRDFTEQHAAKLAAEYERQVEEEQTLSNYILTEDWKNAIALALSLDRPLGLLRLFERVISGRQEANSYLGIREVDEVLSHLDDSQLTTLLLRIRDWNTNAKTSLVAQRLLHIILHAYEPAHILRIPNIKSILDAMVPYTQRHLNRVEDLVEDSYIVDYVL
ncbi:U3 snoRNP-associated protein Utp13 [Schizosaccharomyces japonicus yFS275]|uniref:U3 snoRNP-associated protein Utp13 n=1 Tax=Schizosaccharomyces japonicus (strain yFS275 / FY16936) TaxID=402676 RepID=B6K697_SCHJY|nr:U3 snoRNP-associated protein Utp13 [Schizosaccharomyces japonicus yFS275]EEB09051.1 U3 snoRNP-associated protein Utp13 [Schizosaccharomyces japonicus yFS275]